MFIFFFKVWLFNNNRLKNPQDRRILSVKLSNSIPQIYRLFSSRKQTRDCSNAPLKIPRGFVQEHSSSRKISRVKSWPQVLCSISTSRLRNPYCSFDVETKFVIVGINRKLERFRKSFLSYVVLLHQIQVELDLLTS